MKKLLSITFAMFIAISIQAATLGWGSGIVSLSFGGNKFNTAEYDAMMYLVDLRGSTDLSDMFTVDYTANEITTLVPCSQKAPTVTGGLATRGRVKGSYVDNETMFGNGTYGAFVKYTDAEGKVWYNFSNNYHMLPAGTITSIDPLADAVFNFDFDTATEVKSEAQTVTAGGGWYHMAVPEPATASLALLGVALLIKRRRA